MPAEDPMMKEALAALEQGDSARARDLFTRLLKTQPNNPQIWLYMSAVVETLKERVYCLKEVLRRDPGNAAALRGLALAGALPPGEALRPAPFVRRPWQKALAADAGRSAQPPRARQLLMIAGGAFGLVFLVFLGLFGSRFFTARRNQEKVVIPPTLAITVPVQPSATPTATRPVVFAATGTPVPLGMLFSVTYTPTPLYINTPHPRTEAYRSAMRAFERADWKAAQSYLEQVATSEPGAPDVLYHLGEVFRLQGQYSQAVDAYNTSIRLSAGFAPPHLGLARALAAGRPAAGADVETHLREALRLDPNLADAYLELARFYLQKTDPRRAFEVLETGAPILNQSPLFYDLRARAYLQAKQAGKAVEDARQANSFDLTRLESYRLLAEALQASGDLAGSLKPLRTYLQYLPEDPDALVMLGQASLAAGQEDEALAVFEKVIAMDQGSASVYLARGELYLSRQEGQKALDDYETAMRLKSGSFEANLGKGRALLLLGYNGDAYMQISRSEGFARTDAEKARVHYWRALALEGLKDRDPSSGVAALNDWKALLALPTDAYPALWATQAAQHIQTLATRTPTPRPSLTPSATPTPSATRTPTVLPTAALTATPIRTP